MTVDEIRHFTAPLWILVWDSRGELLRAPVRAMRSEWCSNIIKPGTCSIMTNSDTKVMGTQKGIRGSAVLPDNLSTRHEYGSKRSIATHSARARKNI